MITTKTLGKKLTAAFLVTALGIGSVTGCSSQAVPQETAPTQAEAETPQTEGEGESEAKTQEDTGTNAAPQELAANASTTATADVLSSEELQSAFNDATPYEGSLRIALHSPTGEETVVKEFDETADSSTPPALNASKLSWVPVGGAAASSTLQLDGYNYSVWNMLDWDASTCWAEGNPFSEGTMEGFCYYMNRSTKIRGFRIYPGYQKNQRVYRNNIVPLALEVQLGGYEFSVDLDDYVYDLPDDDSYYWVDIAFSTPVYADSMYVMIEAVTAYSDDPDYDCCITEFHPFTW